MNIADYQKTPRAAEALETVQYLTKLAGELNSRTPFEELSQDAQQLLHGAHAKLDDAGVRSDIARGLYSAVRLLAARQHSDAPASEFPYGDWISSLAPGDEIAVGAQWWNEPGDDIAPVFFHSFDEEKQQVVTVSEWPIPADEYDYEPLRREWDAYTLNEVYGQKYRLFPPAE